MRHPDGPVRRFHERVDLAARRALGLERCQTTFAKANDSTAAAEGDPKAAVNCNSQSSDNRTGQQGSAEFIPSDEAHTVETNQASIAPDPDVAVGVLRQRPGLRRRKSICLRPRLADVAVRPIGLRLSRARQECGDYETE